MAAASVTFQDLNRPLGEVARGLYAWERDEPLEAVLQTLAASAREVHSRDYTLWVWAGRTARGERAWALPVSRDEAVAFSPKGPARALARCLDAAVLGEADPHTVRLEDWHGYTCLVAPGMDEELAAVALAHAFAPPSRAEVEPLPDGHHAGGSPPAPPGAPGHQGRGPAGAGARAVGAPGARRAGAGRPRPARGPARLPRELVASLRDWGCAGRPAEERHEPPSLAIADDPCPRRRHARTVLQRMLRMGKVGAGYHTEFDHFSRGAAAHDRRQALEVGEALLRAGLLGEKPSVGQRHIYLTPRGAARHPRAHRARRDPVAPARRDVDGAGPRRGRGAYGSAGTVTVTTGTERSSVSMPRRRRVAPGRRSPPGSRPPGRSPPAPAPAPGGSCACDGRRGARARAGSVLTRRASDRAAAVDAEGGVEGDRRVPGVRRARRDPGGQVEVPRPGALVDAREVGERERGAQPPAKLVAARPR